MTYSPFGYSLPELSVTGYAAQAASWGGSLSVDVTVQNQGASSLVEPLNLSPATTNPDTGAVTTTTSTADSAATTVEVFAAPKPNASSGLVQVGTISIPAVSQNSFFTTDSSLVLPSRPKGFPGNGGKIYLTLVVDNSQQILQTSQGQNIYRVPNPVRISNPLPNLQVVNFDVPSPLQPGDVISPTIRIANFGTGNPSTQGPVTVELVASLDKNFGPGDSVIATYTIASLPGASAVPTQTSFTGDTNLIPPANINTTTISPVKLPTSPGFYYLGIVIDPKNQIEMTTPPSPSLRSVVPVGPRDPNLPPSGLIVNTNGVVPVFPALPSTVIAPASSTAPARVQFPNFTLPVFSATVSAASAKGKKHHKG